MQMPKPTEADKEYFRSLVPDDPRVEVKPMFGNLGAFVNGNMFMGLFGADVGLKLAEADRERLDGRPRRGPVRPRGASDGRLRHPPVRLAAAPAEAEPWVAAALAHVGALPPKKKK